jgi:hypothetical protein
MNVFDCSGSPKMLAIGIYSSGKLGGATPAQISCYFTTVKRSGGKD